MKTSYLMLLLIFFLTSVSAFPQKKVGVTGTKRAPTKAVTPPRLPKYQLDLKIIEGPRLLISVVSPERKAEIDPIDLASLITDLPTGGDKFNTPNNVFPKVVVEPSPKITVLDLWNPITLFRPNRTDITVLLPSEALLNVEWPPGDDEDVKPNPLALFVEVDESGKLSLNNEPAGTLSDTRPLTERLKVIFKERERNAVVHPGTYETAYSNAHERSQSF